MKGQELKFQGAEAMVAGKESGADRVRGAASKAQRGAIESMKDRARALDSVSEVKASRIRMCGPCA